MSFRPRQLANQIDGFQSTMCQSSFPIYYGLAAIFPPFFDGFPACFLSQLSYTQQTVMHAQQD